jgi:hypothetical protein
MKLRIRLETGRPIQRKAGKNRHLALACGALLVPASLMAYVMGIWRLASDMGAAAGFVITGVFSHWQVWIALGALIQIGASVLSGYGREGEFHMPRFLGLRFLPLRHRPRGN